MPDRTPGVDGVDCDQAGPAASNLAALTELDLLSIRTAFDARVNGAAPALLPLARTTLERVLPPQWKLEWYLPWWLGDAFGLSVDVGRQIVLSNVLGLASVRLQDDLVDGELAPDDVAPARALAPVLEIEAVRCYRPLFELSSPFWDRLKEYLAEWRTAMADATPSATRQTGGSDDAAGHLARRAAPLRISGLAVCLLAGRGDRIGTVDRCLDHALGAMVLYDHFLDWERDLEAGRWNAFVSTTAAGGSRADIVTAMLTERVISTYFARISAEAHRAATLAEELGSPTLAEHLHGYAATVAEQGVLFESQHATVAERAASLFPGSRTARAM